MGVWELCAAQRERTRSDLDLGSGDNQFESQSFGVADR